MKSQTMNTGLSVAQNIRPYPPSNPMFMLWKKQQSAKCQPVLPQMLMERNSYRLHNVMTILFLHKFSAPKL